MESIPVSVLVIEHHPLMRAALCNAIAAEPDLTIAGTPASRAEAAQMAIATRPDIILLTLGNPGLEDLETLAVLRRSLPQTPVLALISNEVDGQEQAALDHGAQAVLTKAAPRAELICKLRELRTKGIMNHSQVNSYKEGKATISS
jgi:DNA-binding NarL/FixJ family response regulator